MEDFNEIIDSLDKNIQHEIYGHSKFQIEQFIIGNQLTDYGKYKQCILELRSRIKNYKNMEKSLQEIKDNEKLSAQDKMSKISELEILLEDLKREIYIIKDMFINLKDKVSLDNREELEKDYWNKKFDLELKMHIFLGLPVPVNLAQSILSLPNDFAAKKQLNEYIKAKINHINCIERIQDDPKKSIDSNE